MNSLILLHCWLYWFIFTVDAVCRSEREFTNERIQSREDKDERDAIEKPGTVVSSWNVVYTS